MAQLTDLLNFAPQQHQGTIPTDIDPTEIAAKFYMNNVNNPGGGPIAPINAILSGYMLGRTLRDARASKEEEKGKRSKAYDEIIGAMETNKKAIIGDQERDLTPIEKIQVLNRIRPQITKNYGEDYGKFIDQQVDNLNKEAEFQKRGELTKAQNVSVAADFRKELLGRTKDYGIINSAYQKMDTAFKRMINNPDVKSKNATDQALIIVFNKMLDPDSVVREAEFARTPEFTSFLQKAQGALEKMGVGGAGLTDAERLEIVDLTRNVLNKAGEEYNQVVDMYGGLADKAGIDKDLVIGGFKRFAPIPQDNSGGSRTNMTVNQSKALQDLMTGIDQNKLVPGQPFPKAIGGKQYIFTGFDVDGMPLLDDIQVPAIK